MSEIVKKIRKEDGQSLVEFALVLPLVLLLIFAVLSFGFLVYDKMIIVLATSQAANRASEIMNDSSYTLEQKEAEIKSVAKTFSSFGISKKDDDVDITFEDDRVTVEVAFNYTFILPLLNDIIGDKAEIPVKYKTTCRIQ